jgi:DNA-binding MarR family transcriptional regulator
MTITIKKAAVTWILTTTNHVINKTAKKHGLQAVEMRVLMAIVDEDGERGEGVDTLQIEKSTGIYSSNVRRALYELHAKHLIQFIEKERFRRLVVTQTAKGLAIAMECRRGWEEAVS